MGGDQRGAGAAAAGRGEAGAALPDAQADLLAVDAPSRRRYWRARETADRARGAGRARPGRPPRHRRRRTSRAGCRYWCRPAAAAARPSDRRASCPCGGPAGSRANRCAPGPCRRRSARRPAARPRAARPRSRCAIRGSPVSWPISQATQRVALPQASASLPSALRMRMKARAAGCRAGSITISWSQPMPVRRSASARAAAASIAIGSRRASSTTKSLPSPCILRKSILRMAPAYMAGRREHVQRRAAARQAALSRARRPPAAPCACALPRRGPWPGGPTCALARLCSWPTALRAATALPPRGHAGARHLAVPARLAARQPRPLPPGMHRLLPRGAVRRRRRRARLDTGAATTGAAAGRRGLAAAGAAERRGFVAEVVRHMAAAAVKFREPDGGSTATAVSAARPRAVRQANRERQPPQAPAGADHPSGLVTGRLTPCRPSTRRRSSGPSGTGRWCGHTSRGRACGRSGASCRSRRR